MITASHNPSEYNGMKFVKRNSVPFRYESGLEEIERLILKNEFDAGSESKGSIIQKDIMNNFIEHLDKFYSSDKIKPFRVVVNGGNGCVGLALDAIESKLPVKLIKVFTNPDSDFPHGVPNPLLPENRQATIDAVKQNKADVGVAWDGDYDRCFFFDENGNFVEGYYIVGILAKSILKEHPGSNIIHDPRLIWNTIKVVNENGGNAIQSISGHTYIKEKMRETDAVYGGEMSAHHYFRENSYSDSGMIPFLLVLQLMSEENKTLSQLVGEMVNEFPCSGEINSEIQNPAKKIDEIDKLYADGKKDYSDGLSIEYDKWRFNVRMSNTEPIIRLNVETKQDVKLLQEKTNELLNLIRS